jgi:hypothetical protein
VTRGEFDLLESVDTSDDGAFLGRFDGLVGRGLVDAYLLEGQCEWSGAVVDQSVPDYLHSVELSQHDDGALTAWHQARISRLIVPAAAPVKAPVSRSRCAGLLSLIGRDAWGGYRVESQPRWAVAWPAAISYVGAVERLSEKAVAAAFTSAGGELGPREIAKRDATLGFMRAVESDLDSMPSLTPPVLPA